MKLFVVLLAVTSSMVLGQRPGTQKREYHPSFTWQKCEKGGQCTPVQGSMVMDAHWRWKHDGMVEGIEQNEWLSNYGVTVSGNSARINFVTINPYAKNVGARFYLLESENKYQMFNLLGNEFSFDVDVSKVTCSMNGAFYLINMAADGGLSSDSSNTAGPKFGTGYCDAQCLDGKCCDEMDLWEANSMATALTPHPCTGGQCDHNGCAYNPYHYDKEFYGPGKKVDTNKVIQVVTQFITTDGTPNGELKEIRRVYVQDGKVITGSSSVNNTITDAYCHYEPTFVNHGGFKQMTQALRKGMVLAFSLWDDNTADMKWLDAGKNGPCTTGHIDVEKLYPNAYVVFSNIKTGPIGSTYKA